MAYQEFSYLWAYHVSCLFTFGLITELYTPRKKHNIIRGNHSVNYMNSAGLMFYMQVHVNQNNQEIPK